MAKNEHHIPEKILLHICCGPCACYVVKSLREKGFKLTGFFYNPNIHPAEEYKRRLESAKEYAQKSGLELIIDGDYGLVEFLENVVWREKPPVRCRDCYHLRLKRTALYAKEHNFDAFSSTLFYSVYQPQEMMKEIGEQIAKEIGIDFYYEDFRKGWQEGIKMSKEMGLYRQKYCGCIFSEMERYIKLKRRKTRNE